MASSSSSPGVQGPQSSQNTSVATKQDLASPLWRHVTVIENIVGGGTRLWICRACGVQYKSSYSRLKTHLSGVGGSGIRKCPKISNEAMVKYLKEQSEADKEVERSRTKTIPLQRRPSSRPPPTPTVANHPFIQSQPRATAYQFDSTSEEDQESHEASRKRTKGPLEKAFNNEKRDIADEVTARCIYACGLSFNVLRSPYWHQMVKGINEAPQGYKSPSYERVRTTLLAKEVEHIHSTLQPIRDTWKETGVSIISDGWKDARNRPLINVVAVCPKGAMFIKAIDCEGQVKDAQFIADILIEAIESVGPNNVVQVITDNAKNCRAAGMIVEGRYEHIFWTPCAVHSLNLILQKIGRIPWIEQVYTEANDIQMFITNHHMSQAIFRTFSKLELLKIAETRFASHTLVLRRLVRVKEALCNMVFSNAWAVWRQSSTERASKIKSWVIDDHWWAKVYYLLSFTEPILSMIRYADTDAACMGEIYDGIDSMLERIHDIIQAKEQDPEETFYNEVKSVVMKRWNKMTSPLHLLAYALNPKYYSSEVLGLPNRQSPFSDSEVAHGARVAFRRLFPDPSIASVVRSEMGMFVASEGHMGEVEALLDKYAMPPTTWWRVHGQDAKYLRPIAIKILSQVASNSSAERNWSTYGFIHSAKRNKLASQKAEDLVYVHSNLRLLSHKSEEYMRGPHKLWDILPETTDLDASAATLAQLSLFDGEDDIPLGVESGATESAASGSGVQEFEENLDDIF